MLATLLCGPLTLPVSAAARVQSSAPSQGESGGNSGGGSTSAGSPGQPGQNGTGSGSSGAGTGSQSGGTGSDSGGAGVAPAPPVPSTPLHPTVVGFVARIVNGIAYAPSYAPLPVQRAIWAGDQIRRKPYIYGGGHATFASAGYDCSGSVSYVLHAAGLLKRPYDSSDFMGWGNRGLGRWITVYTNPAHAFIEIAGIRFDTSAEADPNPAPGSGPRWRPLYGSPRGFAARHPAGF